MRTQICLTPSVFWLVRLVIYGATQAKDLARYWVRNCNAARDSRIRSQYSPASTDLFRRMTSNHLPEEQAMRIASVITAFCAGGSE